MGKLAIHHIGGRGGNSEIKRMPLFEGDFVRVFYDADKNCIEQIERNTSRRRLTRFDRSDELVAEYRVLPYCIFSKTGPVEFNLAYDPNCSSLLKAKPYFEELTTYNEPPKSQDYVFADAGAAIETLTLDAYSLDDLLAGPASGTPTPDLLSIDVEGGESEVLKGAERVLESVVCVVAESQFMPMFEGQSLFGDLHSFLNDRGFVFVRFINTSEWVPFRSPIGLRSRGFATTGDVVYLKDPRKLIDSNLDPVAKKAQLFKLAFCALMWDQMEFALWATNAASAIAPVGIPNDQAYLRFLSELKTLADAVPQKFPKRFIEKFTAAESHRRYTKVRGAAEKATKPFSLMRRLKNSLRVQRKKRLRRLKHWLRYSFNVGQTDVEKLLTRHGFTELAQIIRHNRVRMQQ